MSTEQKPFIIIVSNRGPFSFTARGGGKFDITRGAGGLVTALGALAAEHEVLWVAAALGKDDQKWAAAQKGKPKDIEGISLLLVTPDPTAYDLYYNTIANPLLWFIQHQLWDAPRHPSITDQTWDAWENGYVKINQLFADTVAQIAKNNQRQVIVLPQDYHLYLMPAMLREQVGAKVQIQPFMHIPCPGPDAWQILPGQMRDAILKSLLASDRVGFQTKKDAFNFVQTARFYLEDAHSRGARDAIYYNERRVGAMCYPISVDTQKVEELAESTEVRLFRQHLLNIMGENRLILRTDRVEPSKNILRGLEAFRLLLELHPEHRGGVQMMILLVPSRMSVDEYQTYLEDVMAQGGLINATFSDGFWEPVRVIVGDNYSRAIAAMQLYDVLLVNPLADGMNLVAKEGVLVNQRDGVLVLSENAGAFFELGEHAMTVSPFDVYGTAEAMHKALEMPQEERRERAEALRGIVKKADVREWFSTQIQDAMREST